VHKAYSSLKCYMRGLGIYRASSNVQLCTRLIWRKVEYGCSRIRSARVRHILDSLADRCGCRSDRKRIDGIGDDDIRVWCWYSGFLWCGNTWRMPEGCALRG
jgi:hypothetical protein